MIDCHRGEMRYVKIEIRAADLRLSAAHSRLEPAKYGIVITPTASSFKLRHVSRHGMLKCGKLLRCLGPSMGTG